MRSDRTSEEKDYRAGFHLGNMFLVHHWHMGVY